MAIEYKNIKVESKANALQLESILKNIQEAKVNRQNIALWLPRNYRNWLFSDEIIAAIIATASKTDRHFKIVDWGGSENDDSAKAHLSSTLHGIASVVFAKVISIGRQNLIEEGSTSSEQILRDFVEERQNRVEPIPVSPSEESSEETGYNRSLTYCAIDPDFPRMRGWDETDFANFSKELDTFRETFCEVGSGRDFQSRARELDIDSLNWFIFQLFQNTYLHARDFDSKRIEPNLRYFRIKKLNPPNKKYLIDKSHGFTELQNYIDQTFNENIKGLNYCIISVFDAGPGIVEKFCQMRPDEAFKNPHSQSEKVELINRIIRDNLTSRPHVKGAGKGFEEAITSVERLGGFLSLRTADVWLHATSDRLETFQPVSSIQRVAPINGTIFNLIFPLHPWGDS